MMYHFRRDRVNFLVLYLCTFLAIIFLAHVAASIDIPHMGISALQSQKNTYVYNERAFDAISVRAKAYVVYDIVDEKVIASKNADQILPLASLTKIMTAVTALESHDADTGITITPTSIDGGYDLGLQKNQVWKLSELLKYTLVFSSNDGAEEIANGLGGRSLFINRMNKEALKLGLTTLSFTDPAGLDIGNQIGGSGSALDSAKLFALAHSRFPGILDATTKNRLTVTANTGKVRGIPNTNQRIANLLGAEASKTGFTDSAGGNLAVIVDVAVGRPVVIVVLGSTREERFSDTEILHTSLIQSLHMSAD